MSFGTGASDWEARINIERLRKERLERAKSSAKDLGIEALLLFQEHNIRYVARGSAKSTTSGVGGFRYVFLPTRGSPILYEFGSYYPYVKANCTWLEVRPSITIANQGPAEAQNIQLLKFAEQIKKEMDRNNLTKEGVAIDAFHPGIIKSLEDQGVRVSTNATQALEQARMIKTSDEVECLRAGSAISEAGFSKFIRKLRPGVSENELKASILAEMYRKGIEFVPTAEVTSGPRTGGGNYMATTDRLVRPNDIVVVSTCTSSYLGYRICYYRTFSCGTPSGSAKEAYKIQKDSLYEVIRHIRPGVKTDELAEFFPRADEFGFPDEDQAVWLQWGHGIGLVIPENPTITRLWSHKTPQRIERGMTIAIETWAPSKEKSLGYPLGQSMRIEEMVHVTESGCEVLSRWPIDEISSVQNF